MGWRVVVVRVFVKKGQKTPNREIELPEVSKGYFVTSKVSDLHQEWMASEEYREPHEKLAPELALAHAVIAARASLRV